jgi:hypothetical protein
MSYEAAMSNVRSEPLTPQKVNYNRVAGAGAWAIGVLLTYLFLRTFKGDPLGFLGAIAVALIAQWLLTLAERPLWRWILRRKDGRFILASVAVTMIDGLLNAAGLYPYIGALTGSNVATMIADVAHIDPTIGKPAALVLAGAIGLLVAALAEFYWELD